MSSRIEYRSGKWYPTKPQCYYLSVILLNQNNDGWAAVCLQLDIAAQGRSLEDVMGSFERTVISQVALDLNQDRKPFQDIRQSPIEYWHLFQSAQFFAYPRPLRIPEYITEVMITVEYRIAFSG